MQSTNVIKFRLPLVLGQLAFYYVVEIVDHYQLFFDVIVSFVANELFYLLPTHLIFSLIYSV